jgi:hypothetical protein
MLQSLREAVPLVAQAIASSIVPSTDPTRLRQLHSALKCLEAWMPNLPSKYAPLSVIALHRLAPTPDTVLQRRDTSSAFIVRASRPSIAYFPACGFRRPGSAVCPRFCGRYGLHYVDVATSTVVRAGWPANYQYSPP